MAKNTAIWHWGVLFLYFKRLGNKVDSAAQHYFEQLTAAGVDGLFA
ncbi:MAG: hypothetical protein ABSB91_03530 [Sedimentisphaerales bacterium]